jgi:chaperonin GroES
MYEDLDYEALNEWILVRVIKEDKSVKGGIIIPDGAQGAQNKGLVISKGHKVQCNLEVGDIFCFSEYSFMDIELEGEAFLLVRGDDAFLRKKTKVTNVRVGADRTTEMSSIVSA